MVFVLNKHKEPLMPCSEKRARKLLENKKAVIHKYTPFTIRLKNEVEDCKVEPLQIKIDPGSKETGIAVIQEKEDKLLLRYAGIVKHKITVADNLKHRSQMRRGRRNRNTRYRPARWANRKNSTKKGRFAPSMLSRVYSTLNLVRKMKSLAPIQIVSVEHVKFDMQKLANPEVSGVEYQHGKLFGYEVKEYLLEKYGRKCAYCGAEKVPLEIEHMIPKSKGGTDRIDNLAIACVKCNQEKSNMMPKEYIEYLSKQKGDKAKTMIANFEKAIKDAKQTLKDAASVNTTRWVLCNKLKEEFGDVELASGGRTKFNRHNQGLPKEHYFDAACVGLCDKHIDVKTQYATINKIMGRGNRQTIIPDKHGFARGHRSRNKTKEGFMTGDFVKVKGITGRAIAVKSAGTVHIRDKNGKEISCSTKKALMLQHGDGWQRSILKINFNRKSEKIQTEEKQI
jgi:5-methylcytosine-specific restriction endonuclease McrA